MWRRLDQFAAALVVLFGLAHLFVGRAAFVAPTEPRIWFASAGFLLVTTGLANAAAAAVRSKLGALAALSGAVAILAAGAMLAAIAPRLLAQPQALVLIALGAYLAARRTAELFR